MWGDCYIANDNYMNIVSISKEDIYIFADDERIFNGAYKEINIKKRDFTKMKSFTIKGKRKKLTGLLRKIHQHNKTLLDNFKNPSVKIKGEDNLEKTTYLRNYFFNAEPILE